jgi:hypothetical protein
MVTIQQFAFTVNRKKHPNVTDIIEEWKRTENESFSSKVCTAIELLYKIDKERKAKLQALVEEQEGKEGEEGLN